MTREHLIERLRIVEGDLAFGRYTLALQSLANLIDDAKAIAPASGPARSPLADLPRGSKITLEIG